MNRHSCRQREVSRQAALSDGRQTGGLRLSQSRSGAGVLPPQRKLSVPCRRRDKPLSPGKRRRGLRKHVISCSLFSPTLPDASRSIKEHSPENNRNHGLEQGRRERSAQREGGIERVRARGGRESEGVNERERVEEGV